MTNTKILVVEDEAVTAMDIQITLKDQGYDVIDIVSSGEEAIQKVSESNPDLVLMDINLKGEMNGIEAAGQIQNSFNIPVVYLTVHVDDETLQAVMATEPYGYIAKPFGKSDLRIAIEMAIYRHKTDSKLRKFFQVVENSPVTVMITDTETSIEYVNPKFTQLTGYTFEEAIGQNPRFLKSDNTSPEEYKLLWDTITSGNEWRGEFCNKKKNGDIYWESAYISSIKNRKGVITHFIAVKEDITLVKKLAQEQLESEERFRSIGSTAQDAIIMVDNKGCVSYWNKAAEIMFGYFEREAVKKYLHELIIPDKLQENFQNGFRKFQDTGQGAFIGKVVELTAIRKDGTEFPIEHSVSAVKLKGKWNAVGIIRNITKRKRAEEELKQYRYHLESLVEKRTRELKDSQEELVRKEKLATLGEFAGGVGHELRNPLGVINNSVYFLKMVLTDADDKVREYLEKISSEVKLSTNIISGLMDFSRIQPANKKEEVAVINMLTLTLERLPAPENIEVKTAIPSDMSAVYVDPRKIQQVLFNLISNGYQAMLQGGHLAITASAEKQYVNISIADSGTGISPENMDKIFEPLFTTKARGFGFGLALSKSLVEANGGSIEVKSEEGRGATFTVKLPVREAVP